MRRKTTDRIRRVKPRELRCIVRAWHAVSAPDFEYVARLRAAERLLSAARVAPVAPARGATAASIHRQRIRLKELRYMTELQRTAGGHVPRSARLRFATRQVQLGKITDLQMLLRLIERYGARHPRWEQEATALRAHLQQCRRQLLA
jgi:CHAD domain-containing protein